MNGQATRQLQRMPQTFPFRARKHHSPPIPSHLRTSPPFPSDPRSFCPPRGSYFPFLPSLFTVCSPSSYSCLAPASRDIISHGRLPSEPCVGEEKERKVYPLARQTTTELTLQPSILKLVHLPVLTLYFSSTHPLTCLFTYLLAFPLSRALIHHNFIFLSPTNFLSTQPPSSFLPKRHTSSPSYFSLF